MLLFLKHRLVFFDRLLVLLDCLYEFHVILQDISEYVPPVQHVPEVRRAKHDIQVSQTSVLVGIYQSPGEDVVLLL